MVPYIQPGRAGQNRLWSVVGVMALAVTFLFLSGATGWVKVGLGAVRYVTAQELSAKMRLRNAPSGGLVVDLNRPDVFAQQHIEGAVNLPYEDFPQRFREIDPSLNVYLTAQSALKVKEAARFLTARGYPNVWYIADRVFGPARVLDLNDANTFARRHIRGAINISPADLEERWADLRSDGEILLYSDDGRKTLEAIKRLQLLGVPRVRNLAALVERLRPDLVVVDADSPKIFRQGHIPGSVNLPAEELDVPRTLSDLQHKYPFLQVDRETIVVARDANRSATVRQKLQELGLKRVTELQGGVKAWPYVLVSSLSYEETRGRIWNRGSQLIDVRKVSDYERGHLPGARFLPVGLFPVYYDMLLSPNEDLIIVADDPYHAAMAAKFLKEQGFTNVTYLDASFRNWPNPAEFTTGPPRTWEEGLIFWCCG